MTEPVDMWWKHLAPGLSWPVRLCSTIDLMETTRPWLYIGTLGYMYFGKYSDSCVCSVEGEHVVARPRA